MKKLTLSIVIVLLTLTSCSTPDQPTTENNNNCSWVYINKRPNQENTTLHIATFENSCTGELKKVYGDFSSMP